MLINRKLLTLYAIPIFISPSHLRTRAPISDLYKCLKKTSFSAKSSAPPSSAARSESKLPSIPNRIQSSPCCSSETMRSRKLRPVRSRGGRGCVDSQWAVDSMAGIPACCFLSLLLFGSVMIVWLGESVSPQLRILPAMWTDLAFEY